jgi:hypothetical protein
MVYLIKGAANGSGVTQAIQNQTNTSRLYDAQAADTGFDCKHSDPQEARKKSKAQCQSLFAKQ